MSTEEEQKVRELVCELCRNFYNLGWVTGTGGSISIRLGEKIFMTPSGVQKERIQPQDLFIVNKKAEILSTPPPPAGCGAAKLSDCAPLFLHAYNQRDAGAVLHSHGQSCALVTLLFADKSEFRISQQEMIKGIDGHGYFDELVIPIIENTAWEHELADSLGEAIAKYPKSPAVLVRQHGMYVWGKTWEQAKRHAECLHYLFDITIEAHRLGLTKFISTKRVREGEEEQKEKKAKTENFKHYVFDIEGTLAPITFVKDVLFPYSTEKVEEYLTSNWENDSIKTIVADLSKEAGVESLSLAETVTFFKKCVEEDKKIGPVKQLQGLIWEQGYANGTLKAQIYEDVPAALSNLKNSGAQLSIYSSGSRQAQHLFFQYSDKGDLRKNFSAYFDTKIGMKREASSYKEIALTLGAAPSEILFVTDILEEAEAAAQVGLSALIASRPGNAPITKSHSFRVITSFAEI